MKQQRNWAGNLMYQMGVDGPWFDRLPHFRLDFMPSNGSELQSEYLIPRQFAIESLQVILEMRATISPLLHVNEIRNVARMTFV
ncbi:hypothetical protein MUB24_14545 [Lederbergia sp. NSJ-179]|uniref:hypothetical protein n=1 Tax=Lederbergia sp. NSJ-179 TaxID=2931402 RepID=UPI001FD0F3DE|nr:hypothetical protein [Lederbergia sp. NSJ-179]MCJ7842100.1 hypothetical protein [Lederbergia sp. NSJ-179]